MGTTTNKSTYNDIPSRAEGQPVLTPEVVTGDLKEKVRASLAKAAEQEAKDREVKVKQLAVKDEVELAAMKAWTSLVIKQFTAYVQANEAHLLDLLTQPQTGSSHNIRLEMPIKPTADLLNPQIGCYSDVSREGQAGQEWYYFLHLNLWTSKATHLTNVCQEMFGQSTRELLGITAKIYDIHYTANKMTYKVVIGLLP
jgi:hypothetical protein